MFTIALIITIIVTGPVIIAVILVAISARIR